ELISWDISISLVRRPIRRRERLGRGRSHNAPRWVVRLKMTRICPPELHQMASWPLWNIQAPLYCRPRQRALEPGRYMLETIERDEFARPVKPEQVAHPAAHRNRGECRVGAQAPLAPYNAGP